MNNLIERERRPIKGLMAAEWVVAAYLVGTTALMLLTITSLHEPGQMFALRLKVVGITALLYLIYRLWPCRLTRMLRIGAQLAMLSWWYPDTYEFNRMFPNLDHVFAQWEQDLFGCQPALLFSQAIDSPVFSEMMDLGYASYFPLIALVAAYYFFCRYEEFGRVSFILLTSFFVYYIIFIALPVAGPQYYYAAVGTDDIARGVFPNIGDWFADHQDVLESPGYKDGIFYQLVAQAHAAGERPTAAFPSSHVGVSTILLIMAWTAGGGRVRRRSCNGRQSRKAGAPKRMLFLVLLPFYVLLCLSTVYIQAHYAIDVLAGWASGGMFYFVLYYTYEYMIGKRR